MDFHSIKSWVKLIIRSKRVQSSKWDENSQPSMPESDALPLEPQLLAPFQIKKLFDWK